MLIFSLILLFNRYKNCSLVSGPAKIKPVLRNKRNTGPNVLHVERVFMETAFPAFGKGITAQPTLLSGTHIYTCFYLCKLICPYLGYGPFCPGLKVGAQFARLRYKVPSLSPDLFQFSTEYKNVQ